MSIAFFSEWMMRVSMNARVWPTSKAMAMAHDVFMMMKRC